MIQALAKFHINYDALGSIARNNICTVFIVQNFVPKRTRCDNIVEIIYYFLIVGTWPNINSDILIIFNWIIIETDIADRQRSFTGTNHPIQYLIVIIIGYELSNTLSTRFYLAVGYSNSIALTIHGRNTIPAVRWILCGIVKLSKRYLWH